MVVTKKVIVMILYKANVAITETETDLRKTSHVWFGFFVVAFQVAVFRLTWRHMFRVAVWFLVIHSCCCPESLKFSIKRFLPCSCVELADFTGIEVFADTHELT